MSAPALVALAHGSGDPRSARVVRDILKRTRAARANVAMEAAFLDRTGTDLPTVVDRLVARGHVEVVVVPLLISDAHHASVDMPAALEAAQRRHPRVGLRAAHVLGTDPSLLAVLDVRMREALRAAKARELDGLVLTTAGSSDLAATVAFSRLVHLWGTRHRVPSLAAYASTSAPSPGEAVRELHRRGRRHVAVGTFFVTPGTLVDRATELALEAGALAVSEPLGPHEEVSRLLLARYSVTALDLVEV